MRWRLCQKHYKETTLKNCQTHSSCTCFQQRRGDPWPRIQLPNLNNCATGFFMVPFRPKGGAVKRGIRKLTAAKPLNISRDLNA